MFRTTHRWPTARRLLRTARTDSERAIALGHASHLFVDVIAHNHFVPAHELMWFDWEMVTHASSGWAMDEHLGAGLFDRPAAIIQAELDALSSFAAEHFGCTFVRARSALRLLATAESALRASRLQAALCRCGRLYDRRLAARFDYFVVETAKRLQQLNRVLNGEEPQWCAELARRDIVCGRVREALAHEPAYRPPLPRNLF